MGILIEIELNEEYTCRMTKNIIENSTILQSSITNNSILFRDENVTSIVSNFLIVSTKLVYQLTKQPESYRVYDVFFFID